MSSMIAAVMDVMYKIESRSIQSVWNQEMKCIACRIPIDIIFKVVTFLKRQCGSTTKEYTAKDLRMNFENHFSHYYPIIGYTD